MKTDGYKVMKIQSDLLLGQRWAILSSCSHPEWPEFALQLTGRSPITPPQKTATSLREDVPAPSVVHAGDLVQLWKQESLLRIEMPGVSEESGGLGKTVRVRLLHRQVDDQSAPEHFIGIVRGPSNVEIQR
jgi:flagella basal body P-ring formation protein FlgA